MVGGGGAVVVPVVPVSAVADGVAASSNEQSSPAAAATSREIVSPLPRREVATPQEGVQKTGATAAAAGILRGTAANKAGSFGA